MFCFIRSFLPSGKAFSVSPVCQGVKGVTVLLIPGPVSQAESIPQISCKIFRELSGSCCIQMAAFIRSIDRLIQADIFIVSIKIDIAHTVIGCDLIYLPVIIKAPVG